MKLVVFHNLVYDMGNCQSNLWPHVSSVAKICIHTLRIVQRKIGSRIFVFHTQKLPTFFNLLAARHDWEAIHLAFHQGYLAWLEQLLTLELRLKLCLRTEHPHSLKVSLTNPSLAVGVLHLAPNFRFELFSNLRGHKACYSEWPWSDYARPCQLLKLNFSRKLWYECWKDWSMEMYRKGKKEPVCTDRPRSSPKVEKVPPKCHNKLFKRAFYYILLRIHASMEYMWR